jgi:hypothetical protein
MSKGTTPDPAKGEDIYDILKNVITTYVLQEK